MEAMDALQQVEAVEDLPVLVRLEHLAQVVAVQAFQPPKLVAMELSGQDLWLLCQVLQTLVLAAAAAALLAVVTT
jgi:hypothetical protein